MTCALFAALVLLADAGASSGAAARTDLYGDPLPPGAVARLGTIRLRHVGADVTFSKDGKHLISCGTDGEVRVWDAATGRLVRRTRLAWKPREREWLAHISLAPGGTMATACNGETTYLYESGTGQERGRWSGVHVLAFSPDGEKLAVTWWDKSGSNPLQLWDVAEFKKHRSLDVPLHTDLTRAVFAPDGKQLAALGGGGGELFLLDAVTGKLRNRRKFRAPESGLSLAYAPDGATLAVGLNGKVEAVLLDGATLKETKTLPAPANINGNGMIGPMTFSPDGRLLAVGYADRDDPSGSGVLLWDLTRSEGPRRLPVPGYLRALAFAPDGKTLACCDAHSGEIRLWDVASGRQRQPRIGHDTAVRALAGSPGGQTIASGDLTPTLRLWDAVTGKPLRAMRGDDDWTHACLFSPDGKQVISAGVVGTFQVWDAASGKELRRFEIDWPDRGLVDLHAVGISADGKRLAAIASGGQRSHPAQTLVWDITTGKQQSQQSYLLERRAYGEPPMPWLSKAHAAFAPDGASMSVWLGTRVGIEEIATKCLLATLPEGVGAPLVFSPDGRFVAAALLQPNDDPSDGDDVMGLALIEAASGGEVYRRKMAGFKYAAFSPDGHSLVVVDEKNLRVWDTSTGERLHQMAWPESILDHRGGAKIHSLAVLPGGRAATGMSEGDILIWDLAPATWPVHKVVGELGRKKLDALWTDLADDAHKAYRALDTLAAAPAEAAPFLEDHLRPVDVDAKRIEKLLADLDGESFAVREAACRELAGMRYRAEPMLRRRLEDKPSLETRRRIESILAEPKRPPAESLRTLRAIAALERIGTPEARRILVKLSGGVDARETREAKAALERLKRLIH